MNAPHYLHSQGTRVLRKDANTTRAAGGPQIIGRNTNLFLLLSGDATLGRNLRDAADQMGLLFVHSASLIGAIWQLRALRPGAVLLDLDWPSEAAWETADRLLELESCPPVILVTARTNQFDPGIAVRAGTIVDKSAGPTRLLRLAEQVSAQPSFEGERNSIRRILIRWFRPSGWPVPVTPA
jgi:CheY-like chemotaxis protein